MATTAMEANGKICLLALVNSKENPLEICRPEECSAWSWKEGCDTNENRFGYCVLAGEAARPHPVKRKIS